MKDDIQQELDNSRLFAVKYGFGILAIIIAFSFFILYSLKIEGEPVLYWIYTNYMN